MIPESLINMASAVPDVAVLDEMLKPRVYIDAMSNTLADPVNNIPPYCTNCGQVGYPDVPEAVGEQFFDDEDAH